MFMPSEFIPSEAMMKEHPRRGLACKNCMKLQFRIDSLSFKENREVILDKRDWIRWKEMDCIASSQQIFKYLDQQLYLSKKVCD